MAETMINPDDELDPPVGYIRFEDSLMPVWLPEGKSREEIDVEWVMP